MKKIMMVVVVCLMLAGCSGDYGIFTKEGHDLLTETEREEITESFQSLFEIKRKIDIGEYDNAMDIVFYQTCSSHTNVQKQISKMYEILMQDLYIVDDAIVEYETQYTELKKYINEENVDLVKISNSGIKGMLEFRYAIR